MKTSAETEKREKAAALKFFELIGQGRMKEARSLFAPKCKQHNPYLPEGVDALLDGITKVQGDQQAMPSDMRFRIRHVMVDGNMVAIYTTFESKSSPSKGFRQVHLFRFIGNKIVEYWDITQHVPKNSQHAQRMF
ncbi:MAG: nuclear transport factor 2 family protein [Rhabdochlamydiaceae bacterium]